MNVETVARAELVPEILRGAGVWSNLQSGIDAAESPTEPVPLPFGYDGFSIYGMTGPIDHKNLRIARKLRVSEHYGCPPLKWTSSVSVDILCGDHVCELSVADRDDSVLSRWRVTVSRDGQRKTSRTLVMPYLSVLSQQHAYFAALLRAVQLVQESMENLKYKSV